MELALAAVKRVAQSACHEDTRISSEAVDTLTRKAEAYIKMLASDAELMAVHTGRKTIKTVDIIE